MKFVLCVSAFALLANQAVAAEPSLFTLFKSVCYDTRNDPAAVRAAIQMAQGTPAQSPLPPPADGTRVAWAVATATDTFTILLYERTGSITCEVDAPRKDQPSINAARELFDLPKRTSFGWTGNGDRFDGFFLEEDNDQWSVLHGEAAMGAALRAGHAWSVTLGATDSRGSMLQLGHNLPTAAP